MRKLRRRARQSVVAAPVSRILTAGDCRYTTSIVVPAEVGRQGARRPAAEAAASVRPP